jgi:hypothetical protein
MKDKKNIICMALIAVWLVLGIILTVRVPMSQVVEEGNGNLVATDAVISSCFTLIALVSAPIGYFLGKKSAIILSLANLAITLLAALCFILFILTSNGLMVGYGIMFINPYSVLFAMRGNFAIVGIILFSLSCIIFPIVFSILSKFKPFGKKQSADK